MLNVNFNYIKFNKNNQKELLLNNNFTLNKNNIYTILGNNGSGKSTLLFAIIKILNNDDFLIDGSVEIDNTDLYSISDIELNKFRSENFRLIFQDPVSAFDPLKRIKYYFELTSVAEEEIEKELKYFQLPKYSEIKNIYPHEFSVGMLQRVNIILALLYKPRILLLDEPTSALDLPLINLVKNRLKEYISEAERIILLVTQDIPFAKNVSNYVTKLTNGALLEFSTVDKFFESKN